MAKRIIKCKRCGKKEDVTNVSGGLFDTHCGSCVMYLHYSEEVGITALMWNDRRFITPRLGAYLKTYAHAVNNQGKPVFYRAAKEKAWFDLPLAVRQKRYRENGAVSNGGTRQAKDERMQPEVLQVLAEKKWKPLGGAVVVEPSPIMGTQYKDGYRVMDGGDYLVRPTDAAKDKRWDAHELVELATGKVLGTYYSRQAAQVRAKQLGGNSHKSRRRAYLATSGKPYFTVESLTRDLTDAEVVFAANKAKERKEAGL